MKELEFNDAYSRNKMEHGAHEKNLDEYKPISNYWIALYVNGKNLTYFESFGVEHIPKEIKKFIGKENKYTIQ